MIITTHALTGAAIGKYISNPFLIAIISIIIHFIMDSFHHGEYLNKNFKNREYWKIGLDFLIVISILTVVINLSDFSIITLQNMFLGIFFSLFPDGLSFLYLRVGLKFLKKPFKFHEWVHGYTKKDALRHSFTLKNARNDIIFSLISIILLLI